MAFGDAELGSHAAVRSAQYYKEAVRGDSTVLLEEVVPRDMACLSKRPAYGGRGDKDAS